MRTTPNLVIALLLAIGAHAQAPAVTKTVSGGIVNGKAQSLPKPIYPADAREANMDGRVKIQVLIDVSGKVVSAKAVDGPNSASLRQAAESAALQATFTPTLLSGQPVKVSGVILYDFVLDAEHENEKRLKILGISTFLNMALGFASDIDKFNTIFEGADRFKEAVSAFPEFAAEFKTLGSLEKLSVNQRIELIDKASASVHAKLSEPERWQFEVGKNFGEAFAPILLLAASSREKGPDLSRLDNTALRSRLKRIQQLMLKAPADFPPDVLAKFKDFSAMASTENLTDPENLQTLVEKMMALLETISPDSTK